MVKSVTTMAIETIKELRRAIGHTSGRTLTAYVHPDVAERLRTKESRAVQQLEQMTRSRIGLFADSSLHVEDINITLVK